MRPLTVRACVLRVCQVVGLYFSAHWCPPCQAFTPLLAKFYNEMKAAKPGEFEVVFVSSDKGPSEWAGYYGAMPWLALPFEDRDRKAALSSRFQVKGIPTLVLLDADGNVITRKASNYLRKDPSGAGFPFPPKPYDTLLASAALINFMGPVDTASVSSKAHVLYFFASAR